MNSSASQLLRVLVKDSSNKEIIQLAVEASEQFLKMQLEVERARAEVAAAKVETSEAKSKAAAEMAKAKDEMTNAKAEMTNAKAETVEAAAAKGQLAKELKYSKALYLRGFQELFERNLRLELDHKNPGLLKKKRSLLTGTIEPMCTRSELFDLVKRGHFPDLLTSMNKCGVDDVTKSSTDLYRTLSGITYLYYNNRFEE